MPPVSRVVLEHTKPSGQTLIGGSVSYQSHIFSALLLISADYMKLSRSAVSASHIILINIGIYAKIALLEIVF